jgi:hypothetical protein
MDTEFAVKNELLKNENTFNIEKSKFLRLLIDEYIRLKESEDSIKPEKNEQKSS